MAPQSSAERWQLLKGIFQTATNLPLERQAEYLDSACAGDSALRAEAEALLEADHRQSQHPTTFASALTAGMLSADSLAGCRIGAYEILHEIGRGGMSTVYAGARVDQQFQKIVAIKIVLPGLHFEEIVRRFRHERQLLAGLEHPNIARLLDGGVTEQNLPYLVMEYVEGVPIDHYADSNKLSLTERLVLFRSVCSAVQYAHQNLVVHRDLKPANILVTSGGVAKLLDFGIGKLLRPDYYGQNLNLTLPSVQPLTPEYASPEQIRGEPVNTATDVYSLGVLLYVLLTGRHPFQEQLSNPAALTKAILEDEPAKPSTAVLQAPDKSPGMRDRLHWQLRGDLDTIVLTALRKEPHRRYRSVEHLSDDLARHLSGRPVSARKDTAWYRTDKFVRRHTAGTTAAVAAILTLLAVSVIAIQSAATARRERATAERRFQEGRGFARFVLFQLDDAMQSGITPTRKMMVEKALQYLNGLEKDSAGDPSLQHELIEGYWKVGDLQGNLFAPNVGDSAGALKSYQKALEIANRLAKAAPGQTWVVREQAMANLKLGNLLSTSERQNALGRYEQAKAILEPAAATHPELQRDLLEVLARIGFVQLEMGHARDALQTYLRYLQIAQDLEGSARPSPSAEARRAVAFGYERVGYLQARTGAVSAGLENLRRALSAYRELSASDPENGARERDLSSTYILIGDIIGRHSPRDAIRDYRDAFEITDKLAASDPQNAQYRSDRLLVLSRLAGALAKSGHAKEAHEVVDRAVRYLNNVPPSGLSDYDLMTYCQLLLTKPSTERSRAELALRYARQLTSRTKEKDAFALHLLAQAQEATGNPQAALVAEQKALTLLPRDGVFDSRVEIEQELAGLRTRLAHQQQQ